jgi:sugar phosphate isomerase/epimerase
MPNRRTFLAASAGAALGTAFAADLGMFLALNNSLTGGQPGSANGPARVMEYGDFVRMAAATGYGGVDVTLGNAMKMEPAAVKALLSELKLKPGLASQVPGVFVKDEAAFQANFKRLGECAQFMNAIGCRSMYGVIMPSGDLPKPEQRKIFQTRLQAVSELLRPMNINYGVKFVGLASFRKRQPYEFIWRMDETLEFVKDCGTNIGVMLDSWHWYHAGATPADIVAAGKARITSVHVSDAKKQAPEEVKDDQRVLPGEGIMDLDGFFGALKKIGYEGAISPEPLGRFPREMWNGEGARIALAATRKAMRRAGIKV